MSPEPGFDLHPGAAQDITEIWEYIADDNVPAGQHFRMEIFVPSPASCLFPTKAINAPISLLVLCASRQCAIT